MPMSFVCLCVCVCVCLFVCPCFRKISKCNISVISQPIIMKLGIHITYGYTVTDKYFGLCVIVSKIERCRSSDPPYEIAINPWWRGGRGLPSLIALLYLESSMDNFIENWLNNRMEIATKVEQWLGWRTWRRNLRIWEPIFIWILVLCRYRYPSTFRSLLGYPFCMDNLWVNRWFMSQKSLNYK